MTTPDTSAVRAWARSNGFDVAARGRLPAEVVDAYTASRKGGGTGAEPARKPSAKQAATRKAATRKSAAGKPGARKAPATRTPRAAPSTRSTRPAAPQDDAPVATPAPADLTEAFADASLEAITTDPPTPHAAPASDGALQRLVEQVHALTTRVEALEARAAAQPGKPAKSLFRRQR